MPHRLFISSLAIAASIVLPLNAQQVSAPGAPSPDPRVGLKPGIYDAGEASWNMRLLSLTKPTEKFAKSINSDEAFFGHYVIQGSFDGFQVWDIADPSRSEEHTSELQSHVNLVCRLLLEKKKKYQESSRADQLVQYA